MVSSFTNVGLGLILAMMISGCVTQQMTEVKCPFKPTNPRYEECFDLMPFCEVFQYRPDPSQTDKFEYSCKQCIPGFVPSKPIGGLTKPNFSDLPEEGTSSNPLVLCEMDMTKSVTIPVLTRIAKDLFPHCYKVSVDQSTMRRDSASGEVKAQFKCEECDFIYSPNLDASFTTGYLSSKYPIGVCKRNTETRSCGPICQLEFPGCKKYQCANLKQSINNNGEYLETAEFKCLEAEPSHEVVFQKVIASTKYDVQKEVAIRPYISDIIECDTDWACRTVMPACKNYYVSSQDFTKNYICKECRAGYKPKPYGVSTSDEIFILFRQKQFLQVCELQEFSNLKTDLAWRVEIPGCDILSVSSVRPFQNSTDWVAKYNCEKCLPGYNRIEDQSDTIVRQGFDDTENVKVRCKPEEVKVPTVCDATCQKRFPHCLKYTSIFDPDISPEVETFKCTECEPGFEPTSQADNEFWFKGVERVVCKRSPTPGPVDCPNICKESFPNCDNISITKEQNGHNVYQCNKCQDGYYPIAYEWEVRGRLKIQDSQTRQSNTIYLCSKNPEEVFIDIKLCDPMDPLFYSDVKCVLMQNCRTIIDYTYTYGDPRSSKCMQCQPGFELKPSPITPYDYDLRSCIPSSTSGVISIASS